MVALEHPAYSPDIVPYDFYLLLTTKNRLKGSSFETMVEIRKAAMSVQRNFRENDLCELR
jgi:hypothetical protein